MWPSNDFPPEAWAAPGERLVRPKSSGEEKHVPVDRVIDRPATTSAAIATLPTPAGGPAHEEDEAIARPLGRKAEAVADEGGVARPLGPGDIGISATPRAINSARLRALSAGLRDQESGIRVDTPER